MLIRLNASPIRMLGLVGVVIYIILQAAVVTETSANAFDYKTIGPKSVGAAQEHKSFGSVNIPPQWMVNGAGKNIDSIAFWVPDMHPENTLMFVTAKKNQLIEVWKYPFVNNQLRSITHSSFGKKTKVNGVAVDQKTNLLYVSLSRPSSIVSVFSLPEGSFTRKFIEISRDLGSEPNIALLRHKNGQTRAYVTADDIVYVHNAQTGDFILQFKTATSVETVLADNFHQIIYLPDEQSHRGIFAFHPNGTRYKTCIATKKCANPFGGGDIFQEDAEGIILYRCLPDGITDSGTGFIVVADQRFRETEFEFFDRQTWKHLGTFRLTGVRNTDGIASTQRPLPGYPLGLFAAINNDTSVAAIGWGKVFSATGLRCE
ncbi:MAG: hypothetical protein V3V31_14375 [Methylococcales bacterium]